MRTENRWFGLSVRVGDRNPTDQSFIRFEVLWEGYRESRRCSRDPYTESYITKYTLLYEEYTVAVRVVTMVTVVRKLH